MSNLYKKNELLIKKKKHKIHVVQVQFTERVSSSYIAQVQINILLFETYFDLYSIMGCTDILPL